jgi:hypothetical protein
VTAVSRLSRQRLNTSTNSRCELPFANRWFKIPKNPRLKDTTPKPTKVLESKNSVLDEETAANMENAFSFTRHRKQKRTNVVFFILQDKQHMLSGYLKRQQVNCFNIVQMPEQALYAYTKLFSESTSYPTHEFLVPTTIQKNYQGDSATNPREKKIRQSLIVVTM